MLNPNIIPQLKRHAELGNLILFTGAGFSKGLVNHLGQNLPDGDELARVIWREFYPSEPFDDGSTLSDVYDAALGLNGRKLKDLVTDQLTVDPSKIPGWFLRYFSFPWNKVYTLNIDSTVVAVNRAAHPMRPLLEISCTREHQPSNSSTELPVFCLNGTLSDLPDYVTFGFNQYSRRLTQGDPYYMRLTAEILSIPFVYVGTKLNESSLWQHIELRRDKGGRQFLEMRPRGYLVTPSLDKAKQARLKSFNIEWIPMTAEEFSESVLSQLEEEKKTGLAYLTTIVGKDVPFSLVRDLLKQPNINTDFLLGEEPTWCDITSSRAIVRTVDDEIDARISQIIADRTIERKGLLAVLGTAGSGKSTTMMQLASASVRRGEFPIWIDRNSSGEIVAILNALEQLPAKPSVIFIDDTDGFGSSLVHLLGEITDRLPSTLVVFALRSAVFDRFFRRQAFGAGIPYEEISMPPLSERDIDRLIETLTIENRLGALRGESLDRQRRIFKDYSDRQLLVAMLSATSGRKFEYKVVEEYNEMDADMKRIYCVLSIASALKCSLTKADMIGSVRDYGNDVLNAFEKLFQRHLVVEDRARPLHFKVRHRVIAERLMGEIHGQGHFIKAMIGLVSHVANSEHPDSLRKTAKGRMMIGLINHEFLQRHISPQQCEEVYAELEICLSNYYHFWLQRGSLAVKHDRLAQAENFLGQARGLYPGLNPLIENEYAYMLFKKACERPSDFNAVAYVDEAQAILESLMRHPRRTPHPFHVFGSQGLAWLNRGIHDPDEQKEYISKLRQIVQQGIDEFPHNPELGKLIRDLNRRYYEMGLDPNVKPVSGNP
jgi:hypothetical protein